MRRKNAQAKALAHRKDDLLSAINQLDDDTVALYSKALTDFATPDRVERLRSVFDARIGSATVVLESPYDPHNGAAVIRTCDAFGIDELHVVERERPFLAARQVSRGSEQWVSVTPYQDGPEVADALGERGFELVATHPDGELALDELRLIPRIALVLGNEKNGIFPDLAERCQRRVRVPMRGFVESLNVSVTAAILLQRLTEGRPGDLSPGQRERHLLRGLVITLPHASEMLWARGLRALTPFEPVPDDAPTR